MRRLAAAFGAGGTLAYISGLSYIIFPNPSTRFTSLKERTTPFSSWLYLQRAKQFRVSPLCSRTAGRPTHAQGCRARHQQVLQLLPDAVLYAGQVARRNL